MKKLLRPAVVLAFAVVASTSAYAQATRTYVASANGDDASPNCSRLAPCKTFASAMTKTAASGEINCLDTGGYSVVTITKSITIDCTGVVGGILSAGTVGVTVNVAGGTVTLRGLSIDGSGSGLNGVKIVAALKVNLESVVIFGHTQQAVLDSRTSNGALLVVQNSIISNNAGAAIASVPTTGSGMLIENVISKQNGFGIAVGSGQAAVITRSSFSNNVTAGLQVDAGGQIFINDSVLAFNGKGANNSGTAAMANTSVVYNATGINGTVSSFGNNRIFGNTAPGTALVGAGPASTDLGQK